MATIEKALKASSNLDASYEETLADIRETTHRVHALSTEFRANENSVEHFPQIVILVMFLALAETTSNTESLIKCPIRPYLMWAVIEAIVFAGFPE